MNHIIRRLGLALLAALFLLPTGCGSDSNPTGASETGAVGITFEPARVDPAWQLDGPDDFAFAGQGEALITDLVPGSYTLTCSNVAGFSHPGVMQVEIEAGVTGEFTAVYELLPNDDGGPQLGEEAD